MRAQLARLAADGQPLMSEQAVRDLRAHAIEAFPEECLGIVLRDGTYRRMENAAPDRQLAACLRRSDYIDLFETGQLRAVCHSHPNAPDCPSEADMRAQIELMVPFVICATNGQATAEPFCWGDELEDDRDLVGRPFRHGVEDCYDLVRSWWWTERGVRLPNYPRQWEWWTDRRPGERDLYARYFEQAGFRRIEAHEVQPGDCWMAAVRSEVPNHAGIYLDDGLCLHHPSSGLAFDPSRLSKREAMARWLPWVTHWVRR